MKTDNSGVFSGNTTGGSIKLLWNEAIVNKINDSIFDKIYLLSFIYTIILLVIGCLGNSVVFYIFFMRWGKTTYRVFILALAVFNFINNFITTPTELYFMRNWFQTTNEGLCKFLRFLTIIMKNCPSVTLLGIALDRYRSSCRPFKTQMSAKQAKIIVFVGILLAVVFAWPALVVYGIKSIPVPIAPITYVMGKMCTIEDGFVKTDYPLAFVTVFLVGSMLIDVTLIIAYSLIAVQVIKRRGASFSCQTSTEMRKDSQSYSQSNTEDEVLDEKNSGRSPLILKKIPKQHDNSQEKSDSEADMTSLNSNTKQSINKTDSNTGSGASEKRAKFKRQRSLSVQSEEAQRSRMIKITLMLFLVTLLYRLPFIPHYVIFIIRHMQPDYYLSLSTRGKAFYHFILRSYLLGMYLNPVVFIFMSKKFREECRNCFRKFVRLFKSRN